jgi:putative addiction module antidote
MTQLKVLSVGDSLGVVLPREILERLNVKEGDMLYLIETPDGSMRVTTTDPNFGAQMRAAREGMDAYRNTLRELAK